jgi:uncharacterized protein YaaR (DUF327 family)
MDVFDVLIKQTDEKLTQLKDYLAEGRVENFEEYKKICGEIRGLLIARGFALDLQKHMEESDE